MARHITAPAALNYGYRSIPVESVRVAGTIQKGSVARGQRKGDKFVSGAHVVLLNSVDGAVRSVTVLDSDGKTVARLEPNAVI